MERESTISEIENRQGAKLAKESYFYSWRPRRLGGSLRFARGTTLIEVLVVIAIIATISGIVAFAVFPKLAKAKVQAAQQSAHTIELAAEAYRNIDTTDNTCPTVKTLVEAKSIKADQTDDPWGSQFRIVCEETGDIHVYSNGKDKQEGTADDVRDDFKASDIERVGNL